MGGSHYRILATRAGAAGQLLHVVHDGAEASLCGIPRMSLDAGIDSNQSLCGDCIDWLPKRREATREMRRVEVDSEP